ncbi:MAG: tyrosine-type recombinase/integrase [Gammaproteobacteria bacterium]
MRARITQRAVDSAHARDERYWVRDTEIKGFCLIVYPSGIKTYYCEYGRGKGKKIGSAALITPAQARLKAREILGMAAKGEDPQRDRKKSRTPTLRQFVEGDYGGWAKAHWKSGAETCERILYAFGADFGEVRFDKITAWNLEKWRSARLKNDIARSTVNRDLAALQSAMTKAREWGLLTVNPVSAIKALTVDDSPKVRYLDKAEEMRLRDALDAREERLRAERDSGNAWRRVRGLPEMRSLRADAFADHLKPMVLVSMNTGLRRGELFGLTWASVNLDTALLTVVGKTAKRLKTRYVPLNREALDAITGWKAQQETADGLVFPGKDGKPFNTTKTAWLGVLRNAQIKAFRWHDLRHHFASRLVMAGVDLNTVRELLGHSEIAMTLKYAHLAPEHKAAAVARLVEVA